MAGQHACLTLGCGQDHREVFDDTNTTAICIAKTRWHAFSAVLRTPPLPMVLYQHQFSSPFDRHLVLQFHLHTKQFSASLHIPVPSLPEDLPNRQVTFGEHFYKTSFVNSFSYTQNKAASPKV
jgi:hypothetical protein